MSNLCMAWRACLLSILHTLCVCILVLCVCIIWMYILCIHVSALASGMLYIYVCLNAMCVCKRSVCQERLREREIERVHVWAWILDMIDFTHMVFLCWLLIILFCKKKMKIKYLLVKLKQKVFSSYVFPFSKNFFNIRRCVEYTMCEPTFIL